MEKQDVWDFSSGELPYRAQLRRAALRLAHSPENADDLLQDTYLKAYRYYGTFRVGSNLRAWLFTILRNTFINDYRRRRKSPIMVAIADLEATPRSELASPVGVVIRTAEDELVEASFDEEVRRALTELPFVFRVVVLLADIEGHSYKEIAAILAIPVGTVMSRLFRGHRLLERALLSFGVRKNYLTRRPRRLRSRDLPIEQLFGAVDRPVGVEEEETGRA